MLKFLIFTWGGILFTVVFFAFLIATTYAYFFGLESLGLTIFNMSVFALMVYFASDNWVYSKDVYTQALKDGLKAQGVDLDKEEQ